MGKRRRTFQAGSMQFEKPVNLANYAVVDPTVPESLRRWRALPADLPLVKAKISGRITIDEFNAGNCYRVIYEKAQPHTDGRDSTRALMIDKRGGPCGIPCSYVDLESQVALDRITRCLSRVDNVLIELFCGRGFKAPEAMRIACPRRDPRTVWDRISEALGELERAILEAGVQRPDGAPELAA